MNTQPATPGRRAPGRVLVTGATGLLGSNVTAELLASGTEVLALARNRERASRLLPAHERLRIIDGDITRVDGFADQLRGVHAIVHTAAYFREYYLPGGNDPTQLQRVNVDAVEELLHAAADAGVPVMVHISSATTIGTRPVGQQSDEDTAPDRDWERNGYRASKIRAERMIQAWPQRSGVRVPVVVPAWMWRPGDAAPTASAGGCSSPSPAASSARCRAPAARSPTRATSPPPPSRRSPAGLTPAATSSLAAGSRCRPSPARSPAPQAAPPRARCPPPWRWPARRSSSSPHGCAAVTRRSPARAPASCSKAAGSTSPRGALSASSA